MKLEPSRAERALAGNSDELLVHFSRLNAAHVLELPQHSQRSWVGACRMLADDKGGAMAVNARENARGAEVPIRESQVARPHALEDRVHPVRPDGPLHGKPRPHRAGGALPEALEDCIRSQESPPKKKSLQAQSGCLRFLIDASQTSPNPPPAAPSSGAENSGSWNGKALAGLR